MGDGFTVIRDPLWNNVQVDSEALAILDTEPFQRLRYVRQLGHAFLVYPTAHHTRFEHAVGTYHLTGRALRLLAERGELAGIEETDVAAVRLAGLLHDIGHYPFSHALEEAGLPSHEECARRHLAHPDLRAALDGTGIAGIDDRLLTLIAGTSESPLQGLISGSLDLDKLEYLSRDARMCGVPYGTIDVDRLLHAVTVLETPDGTRTIGVREKGISALESLLFARYQMYRNVYWHHAVRSATAMFKRAVRRALAVGELDIDAIATSGDDELMQRLHAIGPAELPRRLRRRHLYKRAVDVAGEQVPDGVGEWISADPALAERVEDRLASELGLRAGELLVDFPAKAHMLEVDMPLRRADGSVHPLGRGTEQLGIQHVADELHARARRLRIFTAEPRSVTPAVALAIAERTPAEMADALAGDRPLAT